MLPAKESNGTIGMITAITVATGTRIRSVFLITTFDVVVHTVLVRTAATLIASEIKKRQAPNGIVTTACFFTVYHI